MDLLVLSGEFGIEGEDRVYKRGDVFPVPEGHQHNVEEWIRRGWARVIEDED